MAVLIEATSVVVRRDAIQQSLPGGWERFKELVPNNSLCADSELARVGFMNPTDVKAFADLLENSGLVYIDGGSAIDFVVVDQLRGPMVQCDWLEFGHVSLDDSKNRVAAARDPKSQHMELETPIGWSFPGSLSQTYGFVPTEHKDKSLRFLRRDGEIDVYLNLLTGKEVYVGRTS